MLVLYIILYLLFKKENNTKGAKINTFLHPMYVNHFIFQFQTTLNKYLWMYLTFFTVLYIA